MSEMLPCIVANKIKSLQVVTDIGLKFLCRYHIKATTGGNDQDICEDRMISLFLKYKDQDWNFKVYLCIGGVRKDIMLNHGILYHTVYSP